MITFELDYLYLLVIANTLVLALACLSISKLERRCRQIETFWASPTGTALAADNKGPNEQAKTTQRLEQRIGELQRTVKVIEIGKTEKAARSPERNLPIENAVRMARLGASVDDLTRSCGLNIGEARLMKKLHGEREQQTVQ